MKILLMLVALCGITAKKLQKEIAVTLLSSMLSMVGCAQKPVAIDDGWKTKRVIATQMKNDAMGEFVKFDFPLNGYDSDRVEISDWLEERGGHVFQGGGSAFAPAYVKFDGTTDTASMNVKLSSILPGLDELMSHLSDDAYMKRVRAKHDAWDKANKPQWPNTTPPDKTDPYWEFNNNMNANGTPYKKVEVTPGRWQWQIDEESVKRQREYEEQKWALWSALSTRKLTHDEMLNINLYSNINSSEVFFAVDKYAEMYAALWRQWELQVGHPIEGYVPQSTAKGEYNRAPQEYDNKAACESLLAKLKAMTEASK